MDKCRDTTTTSEAKFIQGGTSASNTSPLVCIDTQSCTETVLVERGVSEFALEEGGRVAVLMWGSNVRRLGGNTDVDLAKKRKGVRQWTCLERVEERLVASGHEEGKKEMG